MWYSILSCSLSNTEDVLGAYSMCSLNMFNYCIMSLINWSRCIRCIYVYSMEHQDYILTRSSMSLYGEVLVAKGSWNGNLLITSKMYALTVNCYLSLKKGYKKESWDDLARCSLTAMNYDSDISNYPSSVIYSIGGIVLEKPNSRDDLAYSCCLGSCICCMMAFLGISTGKRITSITRSLIRSAVRDMT